MTNIVDTGTNARTLVDRAAQTAHDLVDRAAEKAAPTVDRIQEKAQDLCSTPDRWTEGCRSSIREHPFTWVGVAALGGVVLSRLLAR